MNLMFHTSYPQGNSMASFSQQICFHPDTAHVENHVVNLYPSIKYESFEGFGGAFTEGAASVYSQMDEENKEKLIQSYFGSLGLRYSLVRVNLDSCDFCTDMYEAMSDPMDTALHSFSFSRTERDIISMLRDAQAAAEKPIRLLLSPWSPPAFMKTNGQRISGGRLKPEYRAMWAEYLCRYITEFQKRGFTVQRITIQNEANAVQTWDSCLYTAQEEKEFLRDYLYPAMVRNGLEDVEVFIWDHNKEHVYERMRDTLDQDTDSMLTGAAFHWYSGDHFDALELIRTQYPGKKLIMSECCFEANFSGLGRKAENLAHEIIGDLSHGTQAFYDWNVLLDERGGPNHVGNFCLAPYIYDRQTKRLQAKDPLPFLYHFSHYLVPGSRRIASTTWFWELEQVAYELPDGRLVLFLLNRSDEVLPVCVRLKEKAAEFMLMPGSISTCITELNR